MAKQTTPLYSTKLQVGLRSTVKSRTTAVTINEQHPPGYKKECRYRQTDNIAEVDTGEFYCS